MAAGLGFKDFVTGEVLTAADVDGYLMQGVWVFASAAARDAAVTSPQEGNFAYLKDTNVTTYYTGSAWANLDTTGMTNPMTTTGDTIYSSSGSTPARLGIGSTGNVLTVAGGVPTWAAPAGGGSALTKIASASFTTQSSVSINGCFSNTYKTYYVIWAAISSASAADLQLQFQYSTSTAQTSDYYGSGFGYLRNNTLVTYGFENVSQGTIYNDLSTNAQNESFGQIYFNNVEGASEKPRYFGNGFGAGSQSNINYSGYNDVARTYTGFLLKPDSGTITGRYQVYGLAN
jgi:hypothetical protein